MAVYMEGPLSKWTNVMKGWQYRWFVLDDNAGLLSYYTSKEKMMRGSRRGCVRLQDAIIGIDDEDDSTFTITVDLKVFHFQARDADERKQWASALEDTILRHSQRQFEAMPSLSLDEFDRRLAEADSYLQLLIENVKGVGSKVNAMGNGASEKQDLEGILSTAQEMVETMKKSIVLLQLAKTAVTTSTTPRSTQPVHLTRSLNTPTNRSEVPGPTHPTDSTTISLESITLVEDTGAEKRSLSDQAVPSGTTKENGEVNPSTNGIEDKDVVHPVTSSLESQEVATSLNGSEMQSAASTDKMRSDPSVPAEPQQKDYKSDTDPIPETSYSSSEDDGDDFFDANDDIKSVRSSRSNASGDECKAQGSEEQPVDIVGKNVDSTLKENLVEASNPDDMYMDEESAADKDGGSVEEHKSVIMHLLSQVKLGMDLTKVVLPTFILERRSLLEMYADFFSHADYFLQIAVEPTPEQRMMACLRFYLSTFAAGRNSSVAKKPYNPILGETFQCFWDEPSVPNVNGTPELVQDGPVPWSKSHQLSFLAEQVSHHPPISAFYAEHKEKKIQFNGHIWTKSKFLGLSIGVHNIGQGCIRLLEHDEEYIINFPNGYGRSILTIPWVELGGDCTITCEKTGYNAFIKFHTKPFYGGKVHRLTGEVFSPQAKKPFCTFEGEWNTVIYANYTSGKSECFIDTKQKKKTPKTVRKIEHQTPRESRRLWEDVTYNLKTNNIDEATNAKRTLEDQQRQEAKERLENNIVYKPKFFHEDDCKNWIYNTPLTNRT